jgi:hypothetical protein
LQEETNQMEQTYSNTLKKLGKKKSKLSAEKKVLVSEIKSLQSKSKVIGEDTEKFRNEYQKKYEELLALQKVPEGEKEQTSQQQGERTLDHSRMLRTALSKIASNNKDAENKETEITRVQALISDLGTRSPHQEILRHMRELLSENCNLQMKSLRS